MLKMCRFNKIKISKEMFLKSDGVERNSKTRWKAMMEFPVIIEVKMKVPVFFGDSLNENILRKK